MFDIEQIASKVVMTPAERAVVVEQASALSVETASLSDHASNGEAGEVIRAYIRMARVMKNLDDVCSMSVRRAVQEAQG